MADPYSFWPYMQPLSPNDFQGPGVQPHQVPPLPQQWGGPGVQPHQVPPPPQQWGGPGGPQEPASLSPQETAVMRGMLNVLRQGRDAMNSGMLDGTELQRLTAAHAYLAGFFEARGMGELGAFLRTIPPPSPGNTGAGDGRYNPGPAGFPFGP